MTIFLRKLLTLGILITALAAMQAQAASDDNPQDQMEQAATRGGSSWMVGGGMAIANRGYIGYSREITPFPLIFYHHGRFFFAGARVGYMASNGRHYRLSFNIKPRFNRLHASDSPQLAGIQTRKWSLDGGVKLDTFGRWGRLSTELSHDLLNRNDGTELSLGYRYSIPIGEWKLTPGLGMRWQSASLTNYYFGVSTAEAIPGRPAYEPGAATSPYVSLGLSTRLGTHWRFISNLQYTRYPSAIHDSPLIDRSGSSMLFIGFLYQIGSGSR